MNALFFPWNSRRSKIIFEYPLTNNAMRYIVLCVRRCSYGRTAQARLSGGLRAGAASAGRFLWLPACEGHFATHRNFRILRRLEAQSLLTVYSVEHNGRLRKYYRITDAGARRVEESKREWEAVMRLYTFIVEEGNHGKG